MQPVAAGSGGDVDQRRRLPAELRGIHRFLDLELLDRVDRWVDHEVVEQLVGDLGAVQQVDVVARSLSTDVGQRPRLLERIAARAAGRNHDGVTELRQREEVPSVQRELDDLAVVDDVADFGGVRLQQAVPAATVMFSATPSTPSLKSTFKVRPNSSSRPLCVCGAKPDDDAVMSHWPGRSAGRKKRPCCVGHPLDDQAGGGMLRRHRRSRKSRSRDVPDDAGDLAGVRLGDGVGAERRTHETDQNEHRPCRRTRSALPHTGHLSPDALGECRRLRIVPSSAAYVQVATSHLLHGSVARRREPSDAGDQGRRPRSTARDRAVAVPSFV